MNRNQLAQIRHRLGKTQSQMADLLNVSPKAVQSFEQGWRNIPVRVERELLFVVALRNRALKREKPCWMIKGCPIENRVNCPTWQFGAGHLCWYLGGTLCQGRPDANWRKKNKACRDCEVYRTVLPPEIDFR